MPTSLHDRLADLAGDAPPGGPAPDLWEAGVRRHRRHRARALAAGAAVVALVAGLGVVVHLTAGADRAPLPADVPFGELHLPRTVYAPSEWTEGTADAGPPGPLAAVALATRSRPEGLTGTWRGNAAFGVSAVDGSMRFLDLPGSDPDSLGPGSLTLSPDGTEVGYGRYRHGDLVGWAVYDTRTGRIVRLADPRNPVIRGTDVFEIAFSGDSRYLETNYSPTGSDGSRDDQLVVWDVRTGARVPAERTGYYWLPDMGSAPSGIVWSRKERILRFDPVSGHRSSERVPQEVVEASYGPDGHALAYIAFGERKAGPWRLFADGRRVRLDIGADDLLGWRDARHVVVGSMPSHDVRYVDVRTGVATPEHLSGRGGLLMNPLYASDLWANDLVDGVRPPDAGDPRPDPGLIGLGAAGVVLVGAGLLLWRRRVRA